MLQVNTKGATLTLQQARKNIQRNMERETAALGKGIFLAMSNANKQKGKGIRPNRLRQGGNWFEGGAELYAITGKKGEELYTPIQTWISRLQAKTRTETYVTRTGKTRTRKTSRYKLVTDRPQWLLGKRTINGNTFQTFVPKKPQDLRTKDLWRKGSTGSVPFSWGGVGLADYYLRKNWRSMAEGLDAQVRISPTKFRGESDNERVLRLLDIGGQGQGSRKLIGYRLHFIHKRTDPKDVTSIYAQRVYTDKKPMVHFKGYNLKAQVVWRINQTLRRGVPPTKISNARWRSLGANK